MFVPLILLFALSNYAHYHMVYFLKSEKAYRGNCHGQEKVSKRMSKRKYAQTMKTSYCGLFNADCVLSERRKMSSYIFVILAFHHQNVAEILTESPVNGIERRKDHLYPQVGQLRL